MGHYSIIPITEQYIEGFRSAVDSVAREKKYLAFLEAPPFELTVRENNKPAIALYEKIGFIKDGFHKNAVRIDNKYENNISMALLFE